MRKSKELCSACSRDVHLLKKKPDLHRRWCVVVIVAEHMTRRPFSGSATLILPKCLGSFSCGYVWAQRHKLKKNARDKIKCSAHLVERAPP